MPDYKMDVNGGLGLSDYSNIFDYMGVVDRNDNFTITLDSVDKNDINIITSMLKDSNFSILDLVILHIGVLGGFLREQVIPGRDFLRHGIMALQGQGDGHGPVRSGGVGADFLPLWVIHRKHSPLQRGLRPLLQFYDFQKGLARHILCVVRVTTDSGQV